MSGTTMVWLSAATVILSLVLLVIQLQRHQSFVTPGLALILGMAGIRAGLRKKHAGRDNPARP
jgi:hypothetical protein